MQNRANSRKIISDRLLTVEDGPKSDRLLALENDYLRQENKILRSKLGPRTVRKLAFEAMVWKTWPLSPCKCPRPVQKHWLRRATNLMLSK